MARLKPLTVDFHETGFVTGLNAENGQGFWFQLTQTQRQEANAPWGPQNPQALNRYAYGLHNPVKYTDPTGYSVYMGHNEANKYANDIEAWGLWLKDVADILTGGGLLTEAGQALLKQMGVIAERVVLGVIASYGAAAAWALNSLGNDLVGLAADIRAYNGITGVIISGYCQFGGDSCRITVINRDNGNGVIWRLPQITSTAVFGKDLPTTCTRVESRIGGCKGGSIWLAGRACTITGGNPGPGNWYIEDKKLCK